MIKTKEPTVELPKDVETLQQMIVQLLADVNDLNKQPAWYKRCVFGRRSEKVDPSQLILFEGIDTGAEELPQETPVATLSRQNTLVSNARKVSALPIYRPFLLKKVVPAAGY
jgi:hypothetical protein